MGDNVEYRYDGERRTEARDNGRSQLTLPVEFSVSALKRAY